MDGSTLTERYETFLYVRSWVLLKFGCALQCELFHFLVNFAPLNGGVKKLWTNMERRQDASDKKCQRQMEGRAFGWDGKQIWSPLWKNKQIKLFFLVDSLSDHLHLCFIPLLITLTVCEMRMINYSVCVIILEGHRLFCPGSLWCSGPLESSEKQRANQ